MSDFFNKKSTTSIPIYFILNDIDIVQIDQQYNMELLAIHNSPLNNAITNIENLNIKEYNKNPITTVVDKNKIQKLTNLTLKNITNKCNKCHACHRIFDDYPLGVPIEYTIRNNRQEIFTLESIVCSFNCMYLLIDNNHSPIYRSTHFLIPALYHSIFGHYPLKKIIKSPHWSLRKEYGGPLNDKEYSDSFQKIKYQDLHFIELLENKTIKCGKIFHLNENT